MAKSILRRIGGVIFPPLLVFLRTNMNFRSLDGTVDFGSFNRKLSLRDRYQLQRAIPELDGRLLWITGPLLDNCGGVETFVVIRDDLCHHDHGHRPDVRHRASIR